MNTPIFRVLLQQFSSKSVKQLAAVTPSQSCVQYSILASAHKNVASSRPEVPFQTRSKTANATTIKDLTPKTKEEERKEKANAKKTDSPIVTVIDDKGTFHNVTLEDAGKLAKKKQLNLIEVDAKTEGIKSGKQVYKLMTKAQFYGDNWTSKHKDEDEKKDKKVKEEKTILLKSKTDEHDVKTKTKQVLKLVEKGHNVRVLIGSVGEKQDPELVYNIMENILKEEPVRIIQKISKNSQVRFTVMPPKVVAAAGKPNATSKSESAKKEADEAEPTTP